MADFDWNDAGSGAVTGATLGTAVMPGVGTAVGAVGGGLIGGFWDTLVGNTNPDDRYGEFNAAGQKMQQNEDQLKSWAYTGNGPSAAQGLLERNRSEGQQRALSNAKAMGGGNPALAAQLANRQQAQVSADAGLQSSTLRAQEQQNAMQAYTQALAMRRQQEIDKAKAQAEADRANAANSSGAIGGLVSGIMPMLGGMMGGKK